MPAQGYISSYFGVRPDPFDGMRARHTGIDIAVPLGSAVSAVAEGVVTYAGQREGYGNVVEIDHGNGYMTRYAHNGALLVHPGERVGVGQEIATAGSTGRSTGPHVHFEVWYKGAVVNPLAFVRKHR
jgi:murein DD-endopeptidase MepM/ murein hydrolase activator NlpD